MLAGIETMRRRTSEAAGVDVLEPVAFIAVPAFTVAARDRGPHSGNRPNGSKAAKGDSGFGQGDSFAFSTRLLEL